MPLSCRGSVWTTVNSKILTSQRTATTTDTPTNIPLARTLLGQAASRTARWQVPPALRDTRQNERPFSVQYRGEEGQDAGGLYYDFLSAVSDELSTTGSSP